MSEIHEQKILVLDFGSQTTQLIARRVREARVYCEIHPCTMPPDEIKAYGARGIILSGGPASCYEPGAPSVDPAIFELGVPVLGICYGMQILTHLLGGKVARGAKREYGPAKLNIQRQAGPFRECGLDEPQPVWMSHGDRIEKMPQGFETLAVTANSPVAAMGDPERRIYGVQFHPEVAHTHGGAAMLAAFVLGDCGCDPIWTMHNFAEATIADFKERLGGQKVICALSGGVDSSVVALLLHKAIGKDLTSIFVDNGVLRAGEVAEVAGLFRDVFGLNLVVVDAADLFLDRLKGITDPEEKRRIIGHTFIEVFDAEAAKIAGEVQYLAQGTLYPDVIESVSFKGPSAVIKSHHNVGGLPEKMKLKLVEPLRELFKDECREVGRELGLPETIVSRQPFPGPGLAIRIMGEVTRPRLATLREADAIVQEEMRASDLYTKVWQSFAVLVPVKTVGVMGDERTYEDVVALRIVDSVDAMTADWSRVPYEILARLSSRIINEVKGVNRVVLDISSKPPSTIEWE
ncbi:GMP synthase [glutamine-hydrolyzing] [Desulfoferula mesophila]|uniref:GMP synthase [glutamine-hydrolyzing] n=1 Tax=Desulfoferula mesophila TaxID=3058419 RepID=A0AAU9EJT9_9BACT|nr:GMP synthase [glutamine-hydrolyzing] [Desulfoferula mesophilus]